MDEKEILIQRLYMLYRERGFQHFQEEFFTNREAIRVHPDPRARSAWLREQWDQLSADEYPEFRASLARLSTADVAGLLRIVTGLTAAAPKRALQPALSAPGKPRKELEPQR